jgi:hypothetical protein
MAINGRVTCKGDDNGQKLQQNGSENWQIKSPKQQILN